MIAIMCSRVDCCTVMMFIGLITATRVSIGMIQLQMQKNNGNLRQGMDYRKFVEALENGNTKEFSELYSEAFAVLCSYLRTTMRADEHNAKDCAQHALVKTMERVRKGAIRDPDSIYSYLLQSAKNRYMRVRFEQRRSNFQEDMEIYAPVEEQIDRLAAQERKKALESCLEKLDEDSREFILFWIENPNARGSVVAQLFNMSVNNVWTKRHRLVKKLSECIKKKMNE